MFFFSRKIVGIRLVVWLRAVDCQNHRVTEYEEEKRK
jgi:hypothetical protein